METSQMLASCWIFVLCLTGTTTLLTVEGAEWGGFEPEFTEMMGNVTVPTGRDAVLSCTVTNLGGHKVGWVKADTKAIQAIHLTVVTHNTRVSVEHVGTNQWKLIIKSVRVEDAGYYMAQINTDPMKSQLTYLDVLEPPDIIDAQTPAELRVRENEALKLTCQARGHPHPRITWKREDGHDLNLNHREAAISSSSGAGRNNKSGGGNSYEGEVLRITQVTKRHMGIYFCIASNGVPPSVSKRVVVTVLFAPVVTVDNQIVGVPLGSNVTLGCIVESSPKSINVWYKDDKMMANHSRLSYEERMETVHFRVRMVLTIQHFRKVDVGRYECRCRNEHGEADGTIKVHDLPPLRTTTTTTTSPPIFRIDESNDIYPIKKDVTTSRPVYREWSPPTSVTESVLGDEYPTPHGIAAVPTYSSPTSKPQNNRRSNSAASAAVTPSVIITTLICLMIY